MKLFISSTKIYGMAEDRRHILDTAFSYSRQIADHIIKCIVYSNKQDYDHWIDEISTWIEDINSMKPKKGLKIKYRDYKDNLFSGVGDDLQDAKRALQRFKRKYVEDAENPYPEFEINYDLYSRLFDAFYELADKICKNLGKYSSNENQALNEIRNDIHSILDKYR